MQDERFSVKLTAGELEYAAAALDDLHAWNEAPPSPLAGKLRAAAQGPVARDEAAELRAAVRAFIEVDDAMTPLDVTNMTPMWRAFWEKRDALRRLAGMEE